MIQIKVDQLVHPESIVLRREPFGKSGGLWTPDSKVNEKALDQVGLHIKAKWKVEAIGENVNRCKVGDYVIVARSGLCTLLDTYENSQLIVHDQKDILAVVSYEERTIQTATAAQLAELEAKSKAAIEEGKK